MKHLKRFVAITISMVMAFQFCTNDFYLYAETGTTDPEQTESTSGVGTEETADTSDPGVGSTDTTTSPDTGIEPSAPVEEQPAAPVEEQPGTPVEEQPEVAGTLKVEFVGTDKETVEQALESKYVGNTIRLDELGIDTNVEGYTLTEVKDKNDSTQVYTTETKDFVLTGNVTELQFVYTQNVQTDQLNEMEDEKNESAKHDSSLSMNSILLDNSGEQIPVTIVGVDSQNQAMINPGRIDGNTLPFEGYRFSHAETASGNRLNYAGILDGAIYYSLIESDDDYYQPATPLGNDSIHLVYEKIGYLITLTVSTDG